LTEGHNPNNNKCTQAVDDTVSLCHVHLAQRYAVFGIRTWASLIFRWRKKYKTPGKTSRGQYKNKSSVKGKENQAPVEVAECTYDLLIAAAPEAERSTSTGPHKWLLDIVRRMAADKKYARRRVSQALAPATSQKAVLHWVKRNPKPGHFSAVSPSAPSS